MKDISAYDKFIMENLSYEINNSSKHKKQIAEEIGVSKPTISQYVAEQILPSLTTFAKLCKAVDCSADDILGLR